MTTFWKYCTEDEVVCFSSEAFAREALEEEGDPNAYILECQGEETEHYYIYEPESDATYRLIQ